MVKLKVRVCTVCVRINTESEKVRDSLEPDNTQLQEMYKISTNQSLTHTLILCNCATIDMSLKQW